MAQAGILLFQKEGRSNRNSTYYLGSVKAKFMSPVYPGDVLKIEVVPIKVLENMGLVEASASVDGKEVAKAELGFSKK
jgi:3-hydroxyacyl-[acyl-carrier-protein] dehydratase